MEVFEVLELEEVIISLDGVIDICIIKVQFCDCICGVIKYNFIEGNIFFGLRVYIWIMVYNIQCVLDRVVVVGWKFVFES